MRTHLLRTIIFGWLLLVAPLVAQEWVGHGRLQGNVKDGKGNPVVGAKVTLRFGNGDVDPAKPGPAPLVTDKNGHFAMLGLAGGTWGVLIEKEDFITSQGQVQVGEFGPAPPVNITLKGVDKEAIAKAQEAAAASSAGGQVKAAIERGNALLQTAGDDAALAATHKSKNDVLEQARGAYQEAMGKLDAAKVSDPTVRTSLMRTLAQIDYQEGHSEQAIAGLKKVLEVTPNDPDTTKLLVELLMASGKEAEANQYMAKLPQGATVDPNVVLNMGISAFNKGDMGKAFGYFDRAVKENPSAPDGYYYRGLVELNQSSTVKAKAEAQRLSAAAKADFQKLLALDPNHAHAADAREFLKSL